MHIGHALDDLLKQRSELGFALVIGASKERLQMQVRPVLPSSRCEFELSRQKNGTAGDDALRALNVHLRVRSIEKHRERESGTTRIQSQSTRLAGRQTDRDRQTETDRQRQTDKPTQRNRHAMLVPR